MIGERASRIEYLLLLGTAYAIPFILWLGGRSSVWVILPIVSLPAALSLMRLVWSGSGGAILNQALANTARLALLYSLLLSIGLILSFR
jgi:1,4-dihydroxy-2-naphthoate octaprenyltransferase